MDTGCENCGDQYDYSDMDSLEEHTTTNYTGMISMIMSAESWVAKWNRLQNPKLVAGVYAIAINDE